MENAYVNLSVRAPLDERHDLRRILATALPATDATELSQARAQLIREIATAVVKRGAPEGVAVVLAEVANWHGRAQSGAVKAEVQDLLVGARNFVGGMSDHGEPAVLRVQQRALQLLECVVPWPAHT